MKHLKLTKERAVAKYKSGTQAEKDFIIALYGAEHFVSAKDRLTGYSSACVILNRKEVTLDHFAFLGEVQAKKQFARHKIQVCIEAINEGWIPNYDNSNEAKYEIWQRGKSYGFSSGSRDRYYYFTSVGSDLVCQTRDKADKIREICKEELKTYLL